MYSVCDSLSIYPAVMSPTRAFFFRILAVTGKSKAAFCKASFCLIDSDNLNRLPPYLFRFLPALKTINLSGNNLESIEDNVFGEGYRYDTLDLSANPLRKLKLKSGYIRYLDLLRTAFTSSHDLPSESVYVWDLSIGSNGLELITIGDFESIFFWSASVYIMAPKLKHFVCKASELKSLRIRATAMETLTKDMLMGCPKLDHFDLSSENLKDGIRADTFDGNPLLSWISLNAQLKTLPLGMFDRLPKLNRLDLSYNEFDHTLPRLFPENVKFENFWLTRNRFEYLPPWIATVKIMPKGILSLSQNPLNEKTTAWVKQIFAALGDNLWL